MPRGTLQVLLVGAKGLENSDYLGNMDPYVILTCRTQETRSTVASGEGSNPQWNESFEFTVSDGIEHLYIKIMDKDGPSDDDFVGRATIPLEPVFMAEHLPPTLYNVVNMDAEYKGEIKVGLTFIPDEVTSLGHGKTTLLHKLKYSHLHLTILDPASIDEATVTCTTLLHKQRKPAAMKSFMPDDCISRGNVVHVLQLFLSHPFVIH